MRVLVVEDTPDVGEGIVSCVARMGHAVDWARDGSIGDTFLQQASYGLVVLDLMLPLLDGRAVLTRMRARKDSTPVLVLTARSTMDDRVGLLDVGADDYMVKPFDFRELEARVRSLMRRRSTDKANELVCGNVSLARDARVVRVAGTAISITRRELSLLEILMTHPKMCFSKAQLLDQLFGYDAEPNENAVEVLVGRLRRKLVGATVEIRTYRGLGYGIAAG